MRELDVALTAKQAARNENVDPARSGDNVALVNDGAGGFRPVQSIDEVLDYGDAREARVGRKISDSSFTTTTIVAHLPKSMCEERQWMTSTGASRSYWAAKDPAEARRYFAELVAYLADDVLRGGQQAIHGFDINLDESRPHIQILADNFATNPKAADPAKDLRVVAAQTWTSHREVRDAKGIQISGQRKMRDYQAGLRQHMRAAGFPVELEVDPVRHDRKLSKADFIELEEDKAWLVSEISKADSEYSEKASQAKQWLIDETRRIDDDRALLEADRRGVQDKIREVDDYVANEVPRLREQAKKEGLQAAEAAVALERQGLADEAARAVEALRGAEVLRVALEAEVQRLEYLPPDIDRFLDRPMKDGRTLRDMYDRVIAATRDERRRRIGAIPGSPAPDASVAGPQLG